MGLSARDLGVDLDAVPILEDVSATIAAGQVTAICGPNGAGKSTLLSALAGLIAPSSGTVECGGQALAAMPLQERAKAIGYLPQSGEVAWDLSVANLAGLGRLPYGDSDAKAVERALAKVEMTAFAERPVSTLSGGEKARALLARVLAGEPQWLLADEPLAALDLAHQQTVMQQLRAEAERGTGVAIVLHDLAQAMNHADHVVVLDKGHIAAMAPPEEALSPEIITAVWGVTARWLGEPGARALTMKG